ncbi:MAG: hypothetical protein AAF570_28450, partial [Bacteroidota bacterium]
MKSVQTKISLLSILTLIILMSGCADKTFRTFTANIPVYQSVEEWRNTTFSIESPRDLERAGKIYIKDDLLFVNEFLQGVHIFDNTNPANPI